MLTLERMATTKNDKKYYCKNCNFTTCKKTNYEIHLQTQKHIRNILATEKNILCENCNKSYINRTGLWRHKKKCTIIKEQNIHEKNDDLTDKQLIMMLIKENNEIKNLMIEAFKNEINNK